ncbi:RebB family R body protein [Thalassovita aquimarina]|nr:RebB family R body protein [Thalassovita aquimarina]
MPDKADAETRKETDAPSQAPDAGKYSDVKVLADAPAMAMGSIY